MKDMEHEYQIRMWNVRVKHNIIVALQNIQLLCLHHTKDDDNILKHVCTWVNEEVVLKYFL